MLGPKVVTMATSAASCDRVRSEPGGFAECYFEGRTYTTRHQEKPRTRRQSHLAETGAECLRRPDSRCSSARNVECATKGNGEVGVVPETPIPFLIGFGSGAGRPCILVTECDAVMDEIADRLHPSPTRLGLAKQLPAHIQQLVAFAKSTGQQEDEGVVRQMLNRDLSRIRHDRVGQATIVHDSVSTDNDGAGRGDNSAAPITETITIADDRYRRVVRMWSGQVRSLTRE